MRNKVQNLPIIFLLLSISLIACQSAAAPSLPTVSVDQSVPSPIPPSPLPPKELIFLASPQASATQADQIASIMESHALENSMQFIRIDSIESFQINDLISAFITLGDIPELVNVAQANPQIQFISINGSFASPPPNLILIDEENEDEAEIAAFLLGLAAALTTDDWRVGVLHTQSELLHANAFIAGVEYFCGACGPVAPPYNNYPQAYSLPEPASWQSQAQEMIAQGIQSVYLTPDLEVLEIQQFFADRGLQLLGSAAPPETIADSWIISISPSSQIQLDDQIIQILNGEILSQASPSVVFSNVNSSLISQARMDHLNSILKEIEAKMIGMPSEY